MSSDRPSPLSRARALLERVVDTVRGSRPERRHEEPLDLDTPRAAAAQVDPLADQSFEGLRVEDGALVWRLPAASRARGEALLGAPGGPALRIVRVGWQQGLEVETHDTPVTLEGVHALAPLPEGFHQVCAIGLSSGSRFVALHHVRR